MQAEKATATGSLRSLRAAATSTSSAPAAHAAFDKNGRSALKSAIKSSNATVRRLSHRAPGAPLTRHASTLASSASPDNEEQGIAPDVLGTPSENSLRSYERTVIEDARASAARASTLRAAGGAAALALAKAAVASGTAQKRAVQATTTNQTSITGVKSSLLSLESTADLGLALADGSSSRTSRTLAAHASLQTSLPVLGMQGEVRVYHPTLPLAFEESTRLQRPLGAVSFVSGPVGDRPTPSIRSLPAVPPAAPLHMHTRSPGNGGYTRYSEPVRVPLLQPATVYHMGRMWVPGDAAAEERALAAAAADPHAQGSSAETRLGEAIIAPLAFVRAHRGQREGLSVELAELLAHPTAPLVKRKPGIGQAGSGPQTTSTAPRAAVTSAGIPRSLVVSPVKGTRTGAGSTQTAGKGGQSTKKKTVTIVEAGPHAEQRAQASAPTAAPHHQLEEQLQTPPYRVPHNYSKNKSGQILFDGRHRAVARPAPVPYVSSQAYVQTLASEADPRRHGLGGVRILTEAAGSNVPGLAGTLTRDVARLSSTLPTDARRGSGSGSAPTGSPLMADRLLSTLPTRTSTQRLTGHPTPLVKLAEPAPEIVTVDGQTDVDELMLSAHAQAARLTSAVSTRGKGLSKGLEATEEDFAQEDADPLAQDAAARVADEHARAISSAVAYTSVGLPVPVPYRPGAGEGEELQRLAFKAAQKLQFQGNEEAGKRISAELSYIRAAFLDRRARPSVVLAPGLAKHRPGGDGAAAHAPSGLPMQAARQGREEGKDGAAPAAAAAAALLHAGEHTGPEQQAAPQPVYNHLEYDHAEGAAVVRARKGKGWAGRAGGVTSREEIEEEEDRDSVREEDEGGQAGPTSAQRRRLVQRLAAQESVSNPWSLTPSALASAQPLPVRLSTGGAIKIGSDLHVPVTAARSMAELVAEEASSATVVAGLVLHGALKAQHIQRAGKAFTASVQAEKEKLQAALSKHSHRSSIRRGRMHRDLEGVMTLHGGEEGVRRAMQGLGAGVQLEEHASPGTGSARSAQGSWLPTSPLRITTATSGDAGPGSPPTSPRVSPRLHLGSSASSSPRRMSTSRRNSTEAGIPSGLPDAQRAAWVATKERARKMFARPSQAKGPPSRPQVTVNIGGTQEVLSTLRDSADKEALLDLHDTHCAVHEAVAALVCRRPGGLDALDRCFLSLLRAAVRSDTVMDRPWLRRALLQLQEAVQGIPDEELPCQLVHDPVHGLGVPLPNTAPRPSSGLGQGQQHQDGDEGPVPGTLHGPKVRLADAADVHMGTLRSSGWPAQAGVATTHMTSTGGTGTGTVIAASLLTEAELLAHITRRCWPILLAEPLSVLLGFTALPVSEYESFLCAHGLAVPLVGPVCLLPPPPLGMPPSRSASTAAAAAPMQPFSLSELSAFLYEERRAQALAARLREAKHAARQASLALLKTT